LSLANRRFRKWISAATLDLFWQRETMSASWWLQKNGNRISGRDQSGVSAKRLSPLPQLTP